MDYRLAFGVLIVPGVIVPALLFWLLHRVPDPAEYEVETSASQPPGAATGGQQDGNTRGPLPPLLRQYVGAVAVLSLGIASFPLLAYHAVKQHLLTDPQVPLVFALAMLVDGVSGLLMGRVYDRHGPKVLLVVPVAACGAAIAFSHNATLVWLGIAIWGVVNGVLDSTVKAVVTELVAPVARSIAFGWLAFVRGLGLLAAGAVLGLAYGHSITLVVLLILGANVVALVALARVVTRL